MDAQDQPPSEVLKKGMEVEAQVLEVDRDNQRISAGIKQLAEDPWETIDNYYKVGDLVTGKVSKLASFGAFVGLEHDIDGLVHISQSARIASTRSRMPSRWARKSAPA